MNRNFFLAFGQVGEQNSGKNWIGNYKNENWLSRN